MLVLIDCPLLIENKLANQPFEKDDIVTFNGEIYNYRRLKKNLLISMDLNLLPNVIQKFY